MDESRMMPKQFAPIEGWKALKSKLGWEGEYKELDLGHVDFDMELEWLSR